MTTDEAKADARQALLALGREPSTDDITLAAIILTAQRLTQDPDTIRQMLGTVETLTGQRIEDNLEQHLAVVVALANHPALRTDA